MDKAAIQDAFNAGGFTFAGAPVRVTGISKDFAQVTIRRGHPMFGFSAEYSWPTIQRIVEKGKKEIGI